MNNVVDIFNEIGKADEYNYHAEFTRYNILTGDVAIKIIMST